jgi:hypothetical protein
MIEFSGDRARVRWKVAEPVVVVHGALAGMRGTIVSIRPDLTCLIRLDGVPRGVLVAMRPAALAPQEVTTVEITPRSVVLDGHPLAGTNADSEVSLMARDAPFNTNHSKPRFDLRGEA